VIECNRGLIPKFPGFGNLVSKFKVCARKTGGLIEGSGKWGEWEETARLRVMTFGQKKKGVPLTIEKVAKRG